MNGLFNNNFLFGFLLSKDLPRQEQLMVGLSTGQSREPMAAILLKPVIDRTLDESTKRVAAEKKAKTLASAIEIELPPSTGEVRLRIPGATEVTFTRKDSRAGASLTTEGLDGIVSFQTERELALAIAVDGTERSVVVLSGPRSTPGAMRRPAGSTAARSASHTGATAKSARGERVDIEAIARAPGDGPEEGTGDIAEEEPRGEQAESASDQSARRKSR